MVTKYDLSETKARPLPQYRLHEKTPLFEPPPNNVIWGNASSRLGNSYLAGANFVHSLCFLRS